MPFARPLLLALGLALLAAAPPAAAQDTAQDASGDGKVSIELNKVETVDGECRAYFVNRNGTDISFDDIRYNIYIFDENDIIQRYVTLFTGAMKPGKTSVWQFDIADKTCESISWILLNDIRSCEHENGPADLDCLSLISIDSRSPVRFTF